MDNQKNPQKNKLSELVESALESIRGLADSGTVVGEPIVTAAGTTIIPVSKVSIGIAGCGNDFTKKTAQDGNNNFSGGGGTGVSMTPLAFLVVRADGNVELLNMAAATKGSDLGSSIETIVEKAPDIIAKIKDAIGSKKKKKDEQAAETTEADMEIVNAEEMNVEAASKI